MDLKEYDDAATQYKTAYLNFCDIKVRPPTKHLNGTNAKELEKYAFLNNYIIATLLAQEKKVTKTSLGIIWYLKWRESH